MLRMDVKHRKIYVRQIIKHVCDVWTLWYPTVFRQKLFRYRGNIFSIKNIVVTTVIYFLFVQRIYTEEMVGGEYGTSRRSKKCPFLAYVSHSETLWRTIVLWVWFARSSLDKIILCERSISAAITCLSFVWYKSAVGQRTLKCAREAAGGG